MTVPIIDLSDFADGSAEQRATVGADVDRACREVGFFAVVGHGVPPDVLDRAHEAARAFFELPLEQRMSAAKTEPGAPYGYSPFEYEALNRSIGGDTTPDLKETFDVGPVDPPPRPLDEMVHPDERAVYAPNRWPAPMPELRRALEAYYRAMGALATTLMDVFAVALGLGDGAMSSFVDRHGSALRCAHYPPLDRPPPPGSMRAGAHTDYGTLTILRLDDEPGLQVEHRPGAWVDVEAPDGSLVVNLGDLMQRWSNDRWRSTMHRVVVPLDRHGERRLTMPFFHNANWDAVIECIVSDGERPRYEPVLAGAHLMAKFRSTVV
ncbi:MAG: 2-oxoglutarate and iron-dependent oxygenase domain-containing protein [Actinomycetota bacterium]